MDSITEKALSQLICLAQHDAELYLLEFRFHPDRKWRFDFCIPDRMCAIEIDGGTFMSIRTGHSSGAGLRAWREKNNAAMTLGWRVWHFAPEEIVKAGRKTMPDEPVLIRLPWKTDIRRLPYDD